MASRCADVLRSMLHLLTSALGRSDQFGPDALPVVGEHRLASHGTCCERLNGGPMFNGNRLRAVGHLRHKRRRDTQMPGKANASPSFTT